MRACAAVVALALSAACVGCRQAPGYPPGAVKPPSEVMDFPTLYAQNCSACHGATGENGPAIDLANPEYQALVDDATLRKWISGGEPGTEMPAFAQSAGGMLTDAQIAALIAGMRKAWSRPNAFEGSTPPPYAQDKAGDAAHGAETYRARCASCHQMTPQEIAGPLYLSLVGDQALRSIIIAGRPDIGQPDWRLANAKGASGTPLSPQDVNDIVAYLGSLRNAAMQQAANGPAQSPSGAETGGRP